MRFMPSSLTSNSHRMLTALVDSRHKKVYKVKNCITDIDPEREKEKKEKVFIIVNLIYLARCIRLMNFNFNSYLVLRLLVNQSKLVNFLAGRRRR